jgi:hypothetical protein
VYASCFFPDPLPHALSAVGKTLVKKPVTLNVYKQKTPLMGGAFMFSS